MKRKKIYLLSTFFIVFCLAGLILNMANLQTSIKDSREKIEGFSIKEGIANFEQCFNENFNKRMLMVNINGLFKKRVGQKVINGVIVGSNNKLYTSDVIEEEYSKEKEDKNINYVKKIIDYGEKKGSKVVYVQHPDKYDVKKDSLPYGKTIVRSQRDDYWISKFEDGNYNILDLREDKYKAKKFYMTDHHWTNESSINGAKAIIEYLGVDSYVCDISNYDKITYEDSFLGAAGIRVGVWYTGKDEFSILIPKFYTNLKYTHLIDGEKAIEKEGCFEESLIDKKILNNQEYNNKYNTFLNGGYVENIIENREVEEGKLLVISDSFARPMVQYLSLGFKETRYLDPQEGRYNGSYIEYIDEFKPDAIVIMYNYGFSKNTLEADKQ